MADKFSFHGLDIFYVVIVSSRAGFQGFSQDHFDCRGDYWEFNWIFFNRRDNVEQYANFELGKFRVTFVDDAWRFVGFGLYRKSQDRQDGVSTDTMGIADCGVE